jgi:hypothetical protein
MNQKQIESKIKEWQLLLELREHNFNPEIQLSCEKHDRYYSKAGWAISTQFAKAGFN